MKQTRIKFYKLGPIRRTLWGVLGYQKHGDIWRFVETETNSVVGPQYPSEKVLLSDMRKYAKDRYNLE
ncbi:unnamed protein product [marine sediment metagenome]|uniref:Uncharacterized protein n=1 Tax=marine sediment metagenome TaxID=412755 RepID=X0VY87_9ZZZZ